jgi:hypothetical protein
MRRLRRVNAPMPETMFGLAEVMNAIGGLPKTRGEIRDALGLVTPGYDEFWLTEAMTTLRRRGLIACVGSTTAAKWFLAAAMRCPTCGTVIR